MFKNLKERLKSAKKTVVAVSVCALLFMGACGTAGGQNSDVNATLWSAPSTVKYMLDDSPVSDYGENMNVSLAANEKESAQLTVTPKTNVKNYEISISDLTGDNGHTISKENVSVFVEKYINVSTVTTVFRAGYYPDALVPYDSVKQAKEDRIKAGQNQTFLFTVYAPENTPAGNYSADVTIKLNGQTRTSKLNVTVYDFAIPTESHSRTSFFLWYDQFMYQCDNVTDELIDNYIDFMLDYRVNTSIGRIGQYNTKELIEKHINFAKDERVNTIDLPFVYITEQVNGKNFTSFDYDGLKYFLTEVIRASSDENNYVKKFKLSFNALDEPTAGKYENVRFVHQKFVRLKQELAADTALFPEGAKEKVKSALLQIPNACTTNYKETLDRHVAGDDYGVDSWCGVYDWYDSEANRYRLEQATEQGDGSWWYGCIQPTHPYPAYHIDDNLLSARALNWMMMDYGIQGNHYWAVNIWSVYSGSYTYRDVWTDALAFPGAVGDGYIIYPGSRYGLDTAIASIRLEAIRDGLEDYEYLYKLKNLSEDLADKYDVFDYDFNENMSKLYDLIYQGTIIHNNIDAFAVARETVAELISLAQKGVLVTFDRSSLNGKITANVYGGDNVSEVKVNNVSATAAKSGEGNLFTASFFPAGYANVSLKCGNENITKKIFVGGLSVLVNSFESESVIGGIVCSDESEYDDIADTSVSLSQEFAKNNSALKISCVKGTSKSYKNSVTLSAQNGVISDSERFAFIDFEVYNPQDKAIEVFVTLKSKNKAVTLVSAVARPGQWSKISLQFVNLGDFDLSDLQSVTFAFSPLNTLENFDIYLDNVKMTARGEL